MKLTNIAYGLLALTLASAATMAKADQLDDVKKKGELVCGTLGTSQPFSFQDPATRELVGYDIDMCSLVAKKIGVKVQFKQISVAARIPELNESRVDILAANLGYSPDRAEQIAFSHAYYVSPQKLLVRADSPYQTIDSLDGQRVGATKGSSSERQIKERLAKSQVIGYADSPAAYLALQQKKVEAQFASELIMARLVMQSPPTSPVRMIEQPVFNEAWGLGVRKTEGQFLRQVNRALEEAEATGEAKKIFEKWFGPSTEYKINRSFTIGRIVG